MLDHASITAADPGRAFPFRDAVMAALEVPCVARQSGMLGYGHRNRPGDDGHTCISVRATTGAVVPDNRHWCFRAPSRAAVDAFHAAGIAAGGRDDGLPGLRPAYHPSYYASFLLTPRAIVSNPFAIRCWNDAKFTDRAGVSARKCCTAAQLP